MKWKKETNETDTKKLKQMNIPSNDDDVDDDQIAELKKMLKVN